MSPWRVRRLLATALACALTGVAVTGCAQSGDPVGSGAVTGASSAAGTPAPAGTVGSSGTAGTPSPSERERLSVVTTVAPLTSIAAAVAGDRADVVGVVPEGINSHTFDPPPQVAKTMSKADLVLVNGLRLEEPTVEIAEANIPDGTRVVSLGDAVLPEADYLYDFSFPREDGKPNPHLWTDPSYAIRYAGVIRDALVQADPDGAAAYRANAASFTARATALAEALKADQASLPPARRQLLTYHDAYAYFAKTYGWTVIGAVQPSNFEDPQPKEIARLIDQVRERKVPVIFGSEVFPSKVLEQIGRETGARYEDSLRDDDLPGAPGEPQHSWQGLMRYNFVTMIRGLGGTTKALDALDISPAVPDRATYPQ